MTISRDLLSRAIMPDDPSGSPPPGTTPNFDHPPNMRTAGLAVIFGCFAVATLAVLMRLYTRLFLERRFRPSDCEPCWPFPLSLSLMPPRRDTCCLGKNWAALEVTNIR